MSTAGLPYVETQDCAEKLGQRALRRPLSAPGRAPGCPEPRPASATQSIGPRWHPGHSGLALDIVARHIGLGDGPVDQRVALAAMCGGGGMEVTGGRGRASGERRAARRTRAIGRISAHPFSRARRTPRERTELQEVNIGLNTEPATFLMSTSYRQCAQPARAWRRPVSMPPECGEGSTRGRHVVS